MHACISAVDFLSGRLSQTAFSFSSRSTAIVALPRRLVRAVPLVISAVVQGRRCARLARPDSESP